MKTVKTSNLIGPALDWAVATCEGYSAAQAADIVFCDSKAFAYSTDWSQGGPIIEREGIGLTYSDSTPCWWYATSQQGKRFLRLGDTPLIAAMRCYVSSKLGDEVEIPEGLV